MLKGSITTLYLMPGLHYPARIPPSSQAPSENQRMFGMGPCIICVEQAILINQTLRYMENCIWMAAVEIHRPKMVTGVLELQLNLAHLWENAFYLQIISTPPQPPAPSQTFAQLFIYGRLLHFSMEQRKSYFPSQCMLFVSHENTNKESGKSWALSSYLFWEPWFHFRGK